MTLVQLVIIPGILLAVFLGVIAWLVARLVMRKIAGIRAQEAAARIPVRLLQEQADAIAGVITAVQDPVVRELLPASVYDQLIQAHSDARDYDRKGVR